MRPALVGSCSTGPGRAGRSASVCLLISLLAVEMTGRELNSLPINRMCPSVQLAVFAWRAEALQLGASAVI